MHLVFGPAVLTTGLFLGELGFSLEGTLSISGLEVSFVSTSRMDSWQMLMDQAHRDQNVHELIYSEKQKIKVKILLSICLYILPLTDVLCGGWGTDRERERDRERKGGREEGGRGRERLSPRGSSCFSYWAGHTPSCRHRAIGHPQTFPF